jgi:hypothetical protein
LLLRVEVIEVIEAAIRGMSANCCLTFMLSDFKMELMSNSPSRAVPESSALRDWGFYHIPNMLPTEDGRAVARLAAWWDESGSLGFDLSKSGTSRHFIITLLLTRNRNAVVKVVKKVFASLSKSDKKKTHGILHAYYEKTVTRARLLRLLADKDIQIAAMVLDKSGLFVASDPHILYASMASLLLNRLFADGFISPDDELFLVPSQMETNKNLNEQLKSIVSLDGKVRRFEIEPSKPSADKGLQAVDFVSWAIHRKYEYGESDYYDIIADKVLCIYSYLGPHGS